MGAIPLYGPVGPPAGLSMSAIPSVGGELLVLVIGLALMIAFVAHVLFSPVEEAAPLRERRAHREQPLLDRPRRRGTGLLRVRRPR